MNSGTALWRRSFARGLMSRPNLASGARVTRESQDDMKTLTIDMIETHLGMSNLDLSIDAGFESAIRADPGRVFGRHAAWNFNGRVWFDGEIFIEEVWTYGSPVQVIRSRSLNDLMGKVNAIYGSE